MEKNISPASLHLPQLTALLPKGPEPSHLLVAGGRPPESSWLQKAAQGRTLWAADHGLDSLFRSGLKPSYFLGDGDSVSTEALAWAKSSAIKADRFPQDKDYTDTQLALLKAQEQGAKSVLLAGAMGGRFDHAYNTLFTCAFSPLQCIVADESEALFYLHGQEEIALTCHERPTAVSLIPFSSRCQGVTCRGLHWELTEALLLQGVPNATSNRLADGESTFSVSLGRGTLGVYLCWE
ncbi:MAG: thiamine diphosphokinase [Selenomonas sp.]|nr:thiamine diphosphokinase [Selenomonas sp.]